MSILYPSLDDILEIHEDAINADGGLNGERDRALIESAVASPKQTYGGKELYETLPEKASALFYSLCKNHGFLDGNKRTAAGSLIAFLQVNNHRLNLTDFELVEITEGVADGRYQRDDIVEWIKSKLVISE